MSPLRPRRPPAAHESFKATEADLQVLQRLVGARIGFHATPPLLHHSAEVTAAFPSLALAHGVITMVCQSPEVNLLPEDIRVRLDDMARREKLFGMRRLGAARKVLSGFEQADIRALVLKGHAFSVLAYGDWATRGSAADLDLLVRPQDVERAERALRTLGFAPKGGHAIPRPGSRLARYALWLHYERGWVSPTLGAVDLHWRALPGGAKWNSGEALLCDAVEVELPNGPVLTLGAKEALIVACSQGESENWSRLKRLADLSAIAQICSPAETSEAVRMSALVQPSLNNLEARWTGDQLVPTSLRTITTKVSNLWHMRTGSGTVWDAAIRSPLGMALPARRLSRLVRRQPGG